AVDYPPMARYFDLVRDVVLADADMGRCRGEDVHRLAGRETLKLRDVVLDHEAAAEIQVRGGVAEALDLLVLRREVRNRVAQEVDEAERLAHSGGGEIADGRLDLG